MCLRQQTQESGVNILFGGMTKWQNHYLRNWAANMSGKLNAYLADIDRQAQERFERLIEGMKQAQGITEQPKAENALEP